MTWAGPACSCKLLLLKVMSLDQNTVSLRNQGTHPGVYICKIRASMWGMVNAEHVKHYDISPIASKTTYSTVERDVGACTVYAQVSHVCGNPPLQQFQQTSFIGWGRTYPFVFCLQETLQPALSKPRTPPPPEPCRLRPVRHLKKQIRNGFYVN